ncbi:hypothetical protein A6E15_11840 [Natrinema saccharevitans]|uniref:Uncharacterized protein n=1 Tax=Natrinema saccharevitans TaxID=301967 RepID=A0A1S8AYB6_9EURY|nr:hypothetical protein [Natrinema saccharevitans]OLZ41632.1 hypothetical protein A6E15_11840 [Natrinema saccharevitans]
MLEPFSLFTSALYVVQGLLGLADQRVLTGDQRSRARPAASVHLGSSVVFLVAGIASASWVWLHGLPTAWYPTLLSLGLLVSILVQGWLYRSIGASGSPILERARTRLH